MGWFWESKEDGKANGTTGDAYRNLDPSLRDFLDKQTPHEETQSKPKPKQQPQRQPAAQPTPTEPAYRAQLGLDVPGLTQEQQNALPKDRPEVPSESLYPDGRYAHLWKSYRSEAEIASESRSDQDKLANVLETIKDRKAAIARAALENCVEEQMAERDCYRTGPWKDRLMMCRTQNREFNRCYSMQSRFLRALGYLSSEYTSPADEEKIQMHADKLYHEMLDREAQVAVAKQSGHPLPSATLHQTVIPSEETTKALGEDGAWARARRKAQTDGTAVSLNDFPPEKQKEVKDKLRSLTDAERDVELQLMAAESRAMREYTDQIERELEEEKQARAERRERGKETVGDSLKRVWGFGSR